MSQLCCVCWKAHGELLQAEGLSEASLMQCWQALCSHILDSLSRGRGIKIPGLCTVFPAAPSPAAPSLSAPSSAQPGTVQGAIKVLLADQILQAAPQLQMGRGCLHHAAVKHQTQGVETVNHAKLAHRFLQTASQGSTKLALRLLVDTVAAQLAARQCCVVDLAVGHLQFKAGGTLAEFIAASGWRSVQQHPSSASSPVATQAAAAAGSGGTGVEVEAGKARSVLQTKTASTKEALGHSNSSHSQLGRQTRHISNKAAAVVSLPAPVVSRFPDKPSNWTYDAAAAWAVRQEARTAAARNAQVKVATFVLPAGGPDDVGGPRMPQGKGHYTAGQTLGQQEVWAAAAARQQQAALARAADAAARDSLHAGRLAALNKRAQDMKHQQREQRKQLAAELVQMIQHRQVGAAKQAGGSEVALALPAVVHEAEARVHRCKQQQEYRACLDAQTADKAATLQQQALDEEQDAAGHLHAQRQLLRTALACNFVQR